MSSERLTFTVPEAGELLGISRGVAYECVRRGQIPSVKLGRRILVPRARLLALLGEPTLESEDGPLQEGPSSKTQPVVAAGNGSGS